MNDRPGEPEGLNDWLRENDYRVIGRDTLEGLLNQAAELEAMRARARKYATSKFEDDWVINAAVDILGEPGEPAAELDRLREMKARAENLYSQRERANDPYEMGAVDAADIILHGEEARRG